VRDEKSAFEWLVGIARHGIGSLDLPILLRLHDAWIHRDTKKVQQWTDRLIAFRETQELRAEELHLGRALARILVTLEVPEASAWETARPAFATLFALACVHWEISITDTLIGYLWTWTENQVLVAVKLVPLGQSAGQRLLHRLISAMPSVVDHVAAIPDSKITSSTTSQLMASALHETQYSRLFRS
jgi:urease accessory protein